MTPLHCPLQQRLPCYRQIQGARGPTLDYKAMHEGKQNEPKRGKEAE
jgi:hypothetical protein